MNKIVANQNEQSLQHKKNQGKESQPKEQTEFVLQCQNLSKHFNEVNHQLNILHNINFSVAKGEMIAIIGASGTGKSTLLQLLGGLDRPSSGEVLVAGEPINQLSEKARARLRNQHLGFVYQFHHLLPEFSAWENVAMPLLISGMSSKRAKEKSFTFLERVGLGNRLNYRIGQLSGGERQRVAIARALVTEPKCVLADEPTGNLDQETADQVYQLMLELNQVLNTSFIVVTHNPELAAHLQQTWILRQGALLPAIS